jgi:hypothetical protein
VKAIGGGIALVGVLIATLTQPDVEPSPPGSALREPSDLADAGERQKVAPPHEADA